MPAVRAYCYGGYLVRAGAGVVVSVEHAPKRERIALPTLPHHLRPQARKFAAQQRRATA